MPVVTVRCRALTSLTTLLASEPAHSASCRRLNPHVRWEPPSEGAHVCQSIGRQAGEPIVLIDDSACLRTKARRTSESRNHGPEAAARYQRLVVAPQYYEELRAADNDPLRRLRVMLSWHARRGYVGGRLGQSWLADHPDRPAARLLPSWPNVPVTFSTATRQAAAAAMAPAARVRRSSRELDRPEDQRKCDRCGPVSRHRSHQPSVEWPLADARAPAMMSASPSSSKAMGKSGAPGRWKIAQESYGTQRRQTCMNETRYRRAG